MRWLCIYCMDCFESKNKFPKYVHFGCFLVLPRKNIQSLVTAFPCVYRKL